MQPSAGGAVTAVVGILLLSGLALVAVESPGYIRGGYGSAFWRLPLDDKLDHVVEHRFEWWWISIWTLVGLFTLSGGVFGFVVLVAGAGETVLVSVALGGYVVAVVSWVFGVIIQAGAVAEASQQRAQSGTTPAWLSPFWASAYFAEVVWIVGSNIAYSVLGVAVLGTGVVADWAAWVAIIGGGLIALGVLAVREGFPQLGLLVPAALGIALLFEAL
jgi:hypothetical protein